MLEDFSFYLSIVVLIVFLIILANKLKVAYPILLVLAGLGISFIPGIPVFKIDPELIFIIFLPPLLYEAAWNNSWKELWHWRRIITSFAFLVVFFTAIAVAFVANSFIPGFSLALGFLLGGIVSPPDAVSASAIMKFVKVPKRVSTILEGESLLNDASSLIVFRFAMIAVATGQFIWQDAALSFVWMVIGGVGAGLLIAFIFVKLHKILPTDVNMDIILSLVTPYLMYIGAEAIHSSGVLSVVCGGLFLSYHRSTFLNASSRLHGGSVWQSFVFLLNGLVFIIIGLDLPEITTGLRQQGIGFYEATGYALLITAVLMVTRIIAYYGAVVVTMIMRNFITVADGRNPGVKAPLILGWTGMRGVVSLAAALSIPVMASETQAFPQRDLILYITFVVILLTLVIQGLTLPLLIKSIELPDFKDHLPEEETVVLLRKELAENSLKFVNEKIPNHLKESFYLKKMTSLWENHLSSDTVDDIPKEVREAYLQVLEYQRQFLEHKNKDHAELDEEVIRKFLHQIDLEEERVLHQ